MKKELSQIAKARLASGMTIGDAQAVIELTYPSYKAREEDPSLFKVGELARLTSAMNRDGKAIAKAWVLFLSYDVMFNALTGMGRLDE